jgi:hypothetical protein
VFRNFGKYNSDAGEIPRRKHTEIILPSTDSLIQ